MGRAGTLYIEEKTFLHELDGSVKFLMLLCWMIITFLFLDIRVFIVLILLGIVLIYAAKIPFQKIKLLVWVMITFNLLNSIFILLITPTYGTELTGTHTELLDIGYSTINVETMFYVLTLSLKYATLLPITFIFIFTTHPSKFASSLNKVGVPYKIAYAVNLAFRYIPEIQAEFKQIQHSQQARGISFQKGEAPLRLRIKNIGAIMLPLVLSSLRRIEVISNAMELRGFGKHKRRTWYQATTYQRTDYTVIIVSLLATAVAIWLRLKVLTAFWYPLI